MHPFGGLTPAALYQLSYQELIPTVLIQIICTLFCRVTWTLWVWTIKSDPRAECVLGRRGRGPPKSRADVAGWSGM